jgi:hypothetical protein
MDAHIMDDRFDRELRRRQLARRLVSHQARTQTIFELTALTRHQLATLRRRWLVMQETRHRGPSPRSFAVFFSSSRARSEAAALATLCRVFGALPSSRRANTGKKLSSVEIGEQLCEVFELYCACLPRSDFKFEHLLLLSRGLAQGDAIALESCASCQATILIDLLATRRHVCSHCLKSVGDASEIKGVPENADESEDQSFGVQKELF